MTPAELAARAKAALQKKAAAKAAQLETQLGGGTVDNPAQAPVLLYGDAKFMPGIPGLLGRKSWSAVMGEGNYDNDDKGAFILPVNLGKSIVNDGLDPELQAKALRVKKLLAKAELVCIAHNARNGHKGYTMRMHETPWFQKHVAPVLKAYNITDMSNWIPTLNTAFYFEEFELPLGLFSMLQQFTMKSRIQEAPGFSNKTIGVKESDTFTAQSRTQTQMIVTAQGISNHTELTEDLNFDSDPKMLESILNDLVLGVDRACETALLNGDTTDPHFDSDVTAASTDARTLWKGFRRLALSNSANAGFDHGGASYDKALFDNLLAKMDRFAINTSDVIVVHGTKGGHAIRSGAIPELLQVQGYGASTLKTGEIPMIYGCKHHISEYQRQDLGAAGVYAASSTKTTAIAFNRTRSWVGIRAPMKLWVTPTLANADKLLGTAKLRAGFAAIPQDADETSMAIGYNVAR